MADALCGPSNALQQFQKHSAVDRTLQQDRLRASRSPGETFRSTAALNSGILDPEFEAFQAGFSPRPLPLEPALLHPSQPNLLLGPSHTSAQTGQLTDWATDFQRMHLANTSTQQPKQLQYAQSGLQSHLGSASFQNVPFQDGSALVTAGPQFGASGQYMPGSYEGTRSGMFGHTFPPVAHPESTNFAVPPSGQAIDPVFDDAAFDRAFDAATSDLQGQQNSSVDSEVAEHAALLNRTAERMMAGATAPLAEILGDGVMPDIQEHSQETHEDQSGSDGDDELARTAGTLLDSVKEEQSEKFQQSSFLALMRQLRDREVVVDGNELVAADESKLVTSEG